MNKISRRELLRSSAIAGGAALTVSRASSWTLFAPASASAQSKPSMTFPTAPRERLAVASWPFRAEIASPTNEYHDKTKPGLDLRDWAVRIPKEFGVNGVEPLSAHFPSTDPHYLESFRKAIENAHMHVVNIPVDNQFCFFDPDPANRKKAVEITAEFTKSPADVLDSYFMTERDYYRDRNGCVAVATIQRPIDAMQSEGLIERPVSISDYLNMSYLPFPCSA